MKTATILLILSLLGGCASYTSATSEDKTVVNAACLMVACEIVGKVVVGKSAQ
jgi:hypothetical protein